MTGAVNGKAVLRLPRLVARVDRAMAVAVVVEATLALAGFLLLGVLVGGVPLVAELSLVVAGIIGPVVGVTSHFRAATRAGARLVVASAGASLVLGLGFHFVFDGPSSLRSVLRPEATALARVFEVSVTLHVVAAALVLLLAVLAFRRRSSVLAIGRLPA